MFIIKVEKLHSFDDATVLYCIDTVFLIKGKKDQINPFTVEHTSPPDLTILAVYSSEDCDELECVA